MIPITDKHLREACELALEQDIAELTAQPCTHFFSVDFRTSMAQMQKQTVPKRAVKLSVLRNRPVWRFLSAAAVIALVCLVGYRLLGTVSFRMGSAGPNYGSSMEESAGQNHNESAGEAAGHSSESGTGDTETYAMEEAAAEDTSPAEDEVPGGFAAEETADGTTESPDAAMPEGADRQRDGGVLPETAANRSDTSSDNSALKKESGTGKDHLSEPEKEDTAITLRSVAYDASTRTLELELYNGSSRTVILENNWILFNSNGDIVNIETDDPDLSNPSELRPRKTTVLHCILPDGTLPEDEYTLDLNAGETVLIFSFP